jgi:hypothetical protein
VTLVGDRFVVLAKYEREALGLREMPLAILEYPLGGIPAEEARRRAVGAIDQILAGITA